MPEKSIYFPKLGQPITYTIGKNAADNFAILDLAEPHHIWFHVEGSPSSHVIAAVPSNFQTVADKKTILSIVKQGAVLCKQHSTSASDKKVPIMYAHVANVQKHDHIVGSVIASKYKTVVL